MERESKKQAASLPSPPFPRPASGSWSSILLISILMLSFNLFGDGLRDELDPTMKEM